MHEFKNILIVEDDLVDRMYITRSLKDAGITAQLFFTDNVTDTLREIKLKQFDLIITDYSLPGTTGLFILESIKKSGCQTPVIMVTSQGDEQLAVEAMKAGAMDYLPKNLVTPDGITKSLRYISKLTEAELSKNRVEQTLKLTENKLHKVLSHSPVILCYINEDGIIKILQGRNLEVTPFESGKSFLNDFPNFPDLKKSFNTARRGDDVSVTIQFKNRYFDIHFSSVKDSKNNVIGVFAIAADITIHKMAEQELISNKKMVEEAAKMKEQFLANMSHEIRTPMHGIIGLTDLLCKSNLDNEQKEYLDAIRDSTDNLLVIINDILDISKIEAGKLSFETISFNLCNVIKSNIDLLKAKAEEKKLHISCSCSSKIPTTLKGDRVRLGQVLINLIGNAIKFTEKGSINIHVDLVKEEESFVTLQFVISDTGIGIPEERLKSIFDSFTQASEDTTRKYGGTGLGLAIVKRLIELQDGNIEVESKVGSGTKFKFTLSYLKDLNVNHNSGAEINLPEKNLGEIKVLLVEDNKINSLITSKILLDWGVELDEAVNGKEGIEMMKKENYDLILMDIQMPEMNGYEASRYIRKNLADPHNKIPILAMTAHASREEKEKCLECGMNDYISKPFNPVDLKKKITSLAGKKINDQPSKKKEKVTSKKEDDKLVNLDLLKTMSGENNDFVKEFIGIFLTSTPQSIVMLLDFIKKKDWENICQSAHKLKPTFAYVGLKDLGEDAARIEELAKSKTGMEEIITLAERLNHHCKKAVSQLEHELLVL